MEIVFADILDHASLHRWASGRELRVHRHLWPVAWFAKERSNHGAGLERIALQSQPADSAGPIASRYPAAYHYRLMPTARSHLSKSRFFLFLALLASTAALCLGPGVAFAQESNELLPLSQVRAGMQGYAYTIFAGDQVEKFNLEVIGVLDNFLGPKQSIILVQLKGPKVEHTGVVAGMSGSPVYLDGKLAGALSLKLGIFTKEPIARVTPINDVLNPPVPSSASQPAQSGQNTAQHFSPPSLPNASSSN